MLRHGSVRAMASVLAGPFDAWWRHRNLTLEFARRDVLGRYRGASFGLLWSLITPFFMVLVYTLAFGYILKSRWPGTSGNIADFAMLLFLGLMVHGFFAECLNRAPGLVVSNPNLVKRIVFPLQVLPWATVLSALFHTLASAVAFVVVNLILRGEIVPTLPLLPVVLAPLAILAIGTCLLLSALSVYLRDIAQVTSVLSVALLFLSSAIVPVDTLPPEYRFVFNVNPLTFIIDQAREVAFWGRMPDWSGLSTYTGGALLFTWAGYLVFAKLRRGFADVL